MILDSESIQQTFDGSAGLRPQRILDPARLPGLRRQNAPEYWTYVREATAPQLSDLEAMLPQESLPQIVDGPITYKAHSIFGQPADTIIERTSTSDSATYAARFLELIERLEEEDPSFIPEFIESLSGWDAMKYVVAFHVMRERDDLKAMLMGGVAHFDDLVLEVIRSKEIFLDNQYIPMGKKFSDLTNDLATEYIKRKAPFLDGRTYAPDEVLRPFLEIARDYCYGSKLIETINTKFPLPKSIVSMHIAGLNGMRDILCADMDMALWMQDKRERYRDLNDDEKLQYANYYLWLLAQSYGIGPAPELTMDPDLKSAAELGVWNAANRDECYAHPLGRIFLKEWPDTVEVMLSVISHEFIHGLEDAALFSIQPEFQRWHSKNPDLVSMGDEVMRKNFLSIALSLSFNVQARVGDIFTGIEGIGSMRGTYYSGLKFAADATEEEKQQQKNLYEKQLRERHAYGYQGILADKFGKALDLIVASHDPLRVFMMAQNAMFKAEAYIKEVIVPAIPAGKEADFSGSLAKIQDHFKAADARSATYRQRLHEMGLAFNALNTVIVTASDNGMTAFDAPQTRDMLDLSQDVVTHMIQALNIMRWQKQKAHTVADAPAAPAAT